MSCGKELSYRFDNVEQGRAVHSYEIYGCNTRSDEAGESFPTACSIMTTDLQTGMAYALLAGTLWGVGPIVLKRALKHTSVGTATLTEQYISVLLLGVLAAYHGELAQLDFTSRAFWAFFLAGAIGASFGKIFYYKGIDRVGASKATSMKNSSPILTTLLAVISLGEHMTVLILAGVLLIVAGIAALTRTEKTATGSPNRLEYFFFPLLAAICFGINPIFKKIGINAVSLPILGAFVTQATALLVMLTFGRFLSVKPKWELIPVKALALVTLSSLTEALGSLFTFFALIYAPAVLVSPMWRISPLVTFALAHFSLRGIEVVTLRDGLAAGLIVGGVFVLSQG